jgi:hypothetical protein
MPKAQLHTAGLMERAARRGKHRRKRPREPCHVSENQIGEIFDKVGRVIRALN